MDVLVITPVPLITGVVVRCRALGVLKMTDESGEDAKLLAVPVGQVVYALSAYHDDCGFARIDFATNCSFF